MRGAQLSDTPGPEPGKRTQDTGTLIAGLVGAPWGRDAVWEFTKTNWPILTEKLGVFQGIPGIIGSLSAFSSTEQAAEIRQFFIKTPIPSAERTLRQSLERIENCAALVRRQSPAITTWLATTAHSH